jgi:hypothetical protein
MAAPLDRLLAWLTQHNAAVMVVLLLVTPRWSARASPGSDRITPGE